MVCMSNRYQCVENLNILMECNKRRKFIRIRNIAILWYTHIYMIPDHVVSILHSYVAI